MKPKFIFFVVCCVLFVSCSQQSDSYSQTAFIPKTHAYYGGYIQEPVEITVPLAYHESDDFDFNNVFAMKINGEQIIEGLQVTKADTQKHGDYYYCAFIATVTIDQPGAIIFDRITLTDAQDREIELSVSDWKLDIREKLGYHTTLLEGELFVTGLRAEYYKVLPYSNDHYYRVQLKNCTAQPVTVEKISFENEAGIIFSAADLQMNDATASLILLPDEEKAFSFTFDGGADYFLMNVAPFLEYTIEDESHYMLLPAMKYSPYINENFFKAIDEGFADQN